VDEEFLAAALDFIERKSKEEAPWFCYFNPTRMHVFTRYGSDAPKLSLRSCLVLCSKIAFAAVFTLGDY